MPTVTEIFLKEEEKEWGEAVYWRGVKTILKPKYKDKTKILKSFKHVLKTKQKKQCVTDPPNKPIVQWIRIEYSQTHAGVGTRAQSSGMCCDLTNDPCLP